MNERKYRIDLEPSGKRWTWTVWGHGCQYDEAGTEAWRPPNVAFDMRLPLSCPERKFEGGTKTLYAAELAARQFIALVETWHSDEARHERQTIRIEVSA